MANRSSTGHQPPAYRAASTERAVRRQRCEQDRTCSQQRAHFFRHANGLPQTRQTFVGTGRFPIMPLWFLSEECERLLTILGCPPAVTAGSTTSLPPFRILLHRTPTVPATSMPQGNALSLNPRSRILPEGCKSCLRLPQGRNVVHDRCWVVASDQAACRLLYR